ncbi:unnamed protein product [Urochloa decumbens]|uniref:F-box domain-containing protein n=1 Tax=Urochloa decumbens TaxID=240449 RepID=A0ABC8W707_9POAL
MFGEKWGEIERLTGGPRMDGLHSSESEDRDRSPPLPFRSQARSSPRPLPLPPPFAQDHCSLRQSRNSELHASHLAEAPVGWGTPAAAIPLPNRTRGFRRASLVGMEEGGSRREAAAALPDELVIEILARLPAKSLCRSSCVSRAWRALISDPANRRRFAQTLSGLFVSRPHGSWGFVDLSTASPPRPDTAFSFLRPTCGEMELLDSCNGLLLLRCTGASESPAPPFYVVCNPATGDWVSLPQPSRAPGLNDGFSDTYSAALGFDPAVSSNFHVFQLLQEYYEGNSDLFVVAVEIYSSETGSWVFKESGWSEVDIRFTGQMTYFSGFLHFCIVSNAVASVDTEGQAWKVSRVLHNAVYGYDSSISHSQGRLLYVDRSVWRSDTLSIYILEDHNSEEWIWTFKQSIYKMDLFGPRPAQGGWDYYMAAFHPDGNLVFFYDVLQKRLMSCDMKHGDVRAICTLGEVLELVHGYEYDVRRLFLPYVPLYSRALASPFVN